jgi:hypothetical protein
MPWTGPGEDPTAGIPPLQEMPADAQAAGLPGAPSGGGMPGAGGGYGPNGAFSLEDSNTLARWARGDLELGPGAASTAVPTGTQAAAPSDGRKSVVPPIPQGYRPLYDPYQIEQDIANKSLLGLPTGYLEEIAKSLRAGDMEYSNPQTGDRRWLPMPGGAKDAGAQVAAGAEGLKTTATHAAAAPYETVKAQVWTPQGIVEMDLPRDQYNAAVDRMFGPGGSGASGPGGPGPAAGGPGPAAGGPGSAAGGPTLAGQPVARPGAQEGFQRLGEINAAASDASLQAQNLQDIKNLIPVVGKTGWGADTRAQAAKIAQGLGATPEQTQALFSINPNDADALQKQFVRLSTAAVRQMGAREPGSVINLFQKAFPSFETTPPSLDHMVNLMQMEQQRALDKRDFVNNALTAPGGYGAGGMPGLLSQAEANFDRQSGDTYLRAANAMTPNSPLPSWTPDALAGGTSPQTATGFTPYGNQIYSHIPAGGTFYDHLGRQQTKPRQ